MTDELKGKQRKEERYITTPKFDKLIKKIMKEQRQIEDFPND